MRMKAFAAILLLPAAAFGQANAGEAPQCPGSEFIGDPNSSPVIEILETSEDHVRGRAANVDPGWVRVVLYAKTTEWFVQPFTAMPFTEICSDGSWESFTHPWERMAALLVDETYLPEDVRVLHPSNATGILAWDEVPEPRQVELSGRSWVVKSSGSQMVGPGPNFFSDSEENVFVDGQGLHLKISRRDDQWFSAEVFLPESLGYGQYRFTADSRLDQLDGRSVFGAFIFEAGDKEVDIEFSKALADPNDAQYVAQPFARPGNLVRFDMPDEGLTSHLFDWRPDRIEFVSWAGESDAPQPDDIIFSWLYLGPDIPPPGGERMRFNLWLFQGQPPQSGQGDEVVIRSFDFRPQQGRELYFAQFADGSGLSSQINLSNRDAEGKAPAKVQATIRGDDGQPLSVDFNGKVAEGQLNASIPPSGLLVLQTDGAGDVQVGSVTVASDKALEGVLIFSGPGLGLAGVGNSIELCQGFSTPAESRPPAVRTGVAVQNLEEGLTTLGFQLLRPDGTVAASSDGSLLDPEGKPVSPVAGRGHIAVFIDELAWDNPQIAADFTGTLSVASSGRIAATAIQSRPGQFATLPVIPQGSCF